MNKCFYLQGQKLRDSFHSYIICVWAFCPRVCLCTACMPGANGGQKEVLDPLELDIQMVVNQHVGAGNWTQLPWKSNQALNKGAIAPARGRKSIAGTPILCSGTFSGCTSLWTCFLSWSCTLLLRDLGSSTRRLPSHHRKLRVCAVFLWRMIICQLFLCCPGKFSWFSLNLLWLLLISVALSIVGYPIDRIKGLLCGCTPGSRLASWVYLVIPDPSVFLWLRFYSWL